MSRDDQATLERLLSRRDFNGKALLALLAGVAVTVSGCGGGSNSPTAATPMPAGNGDKVGSISANHGHTAVITSVQLSSGGAITLHIQGSATHDHTVDFSADDIRAIASGTRTSRNSSTQEDHDHTVTFN
jgi:hypothetical protein